ncbi:MAG: hypothetical protein ACPG21_14100 [Crocinitomicaceae bacterium]
MGAIGFFILLGLFTYYFYRWGKRASVSFTDLMITWGIKLLFSFTFIWVFQYYYGNGVLYGDAYNFFNDAYLLNQYAYVDPAGYLELLFGLNPEQSIETLPYVSETQIWSYVDNGDLYNDNRLIIRLNSLIHFISFGNVYVHTLVMSFLSFLGILMIYRTYETYFPYKRFAFFVLLLFPSITFWGSGITKEALLFFGMGLFFYGGQQCINRFGWKHLVSLIAGVLVLLLNKPHVSLFLLVFAPLLPISRIFPLSKSLRTAAYFMLPLLFLAFTYTPSSINMLEKISYKQKDMINMGKGGIFFVTDSSFCAFDYAEKSHFDIDTVTNKIEIHHTTHGEYKLFGESKFNRFKMTPSQNEYDIYLIQPPSYSYINTTPIDYNRWNLLRAAPNALTNTLFRPYPNDPGSPMKFAAFGSNLLLLIFIVYSIAQRKNLSPEEKTIRLYLTLTALCILLLIGWTIPILGAIVRYKVGAELLLLLFALIAAKKPYDNNINRTS